MRVHIEIYDDHLELKSKMGLRAAKESFLAKLPQEHKEKCRRRRRGGEGLKRNLYSCMSAYDVLKTFGNFTCCLHVKDVRANCLCATFLRR